MNHFHRSFKFTKIWQPDSTCKCKVPQHSPLRKSPGTFVKIQLSALGTGSLTWGPDPGPRSLCTQQASSIELTHAVLRGTVPSRAAPGPEGHSQEVRRGANRSPRTRRGNLLSFFSNKLMRENHTTTHIRQHSIYLFHIRNLELKVYSDKKSYLQRESLLQSNAFLFHVSFSKVLVIKMKIIVFPTGYIWSIFSSC